MGKDGTSQRSEGAILGMGANAVVHRVRLEKVRDDAGPSDAERPAKRARREALSGEAVSAVLTRVQSAARLTSLEAQRRPSQAYAAPGQLRRLGRRREPLNGGTPTLGPLRQ